MQKYTLIALALAAGTAGAAPRQAEDLGRLSNRNEQVSATVALKLRNQDQLESLMRQLYDRASPAYHHFLTADEFRARFAPERATVERVTRSLAAHGLRVELLNGAYLRVTGPASAMERAFGVELHAFSAGGKTFHAPLSAPHVQADLAAGVEGVVGLDSRPHYRTHLHRAPEGLRNALRPRLTPPPNTADQPGLWTVSDAAQYYDINPLYHAGITGQGATIGIVTLASFTPSDAFYYWRTMVGLTVDSSRLSIVNIDGGPGAPSDASGSDETTLDVEQSGGLAPGAKIIVYQAPNTDLGFIDAFAAAIGDNHADAISCSWGEWEAFLDGDTLTAFHNLFAQAAIQGQSMSASSGDAGSYDASEFFPQPQFTTVLSVDHPAADPLICAAGGTTLPGPQGFENSSGVIAIANVPQESAWGWDYLTSVCKELGFGSPVNCGIFPGGSGGGVSSAFPVPSYQDGLGGIATTATGQVLKDTSTRPPTTLIAMPSKFPGRNLPDISLNADPDTGYVISYTSDKGGFIILDFFGGTSFVAPQLAGISALIHQSAGRRIGLLNFALYDLAQSGTAYSGTHAPLRDIKGGDNWGYSAGTGYDQATGLGVLDVTNFAATFH